MSCRDIYCGRLLWHHRHIGDILLRARFDRVDLADEDEKFMKYLAENGWEGEVGEGDIWS